MNEKELAAALDRVHLGVFLHDTFSAFYGSLLSSLDHKWDNSCETAYMDGKCIAWKPNWFASLQPTQRIAVMQHELEHIIRLHMVRQGNRDPQIWNQACDHAINLALIKEGYDIATIPGGLADPRFTDKTEEQIYEILLSEQQKNTSNTPAPAPWGDPNGDMKPALSEEDIQEVVSKVIMATQVASMAAGDVPGTTKQYLEAFLKPVVNWKNQFQQFFTDLLEEEHTWARPNRRHLHTGMYLPSRYLDEGRLAHLMYCLDVSGSVTDEQIIRFNSEVKYVHDTFKPKKLTLVQFDSKIQKETVIEEGDDFHGIEVVGRGGTNLEPVRKKIMKDRPTAAVIFSDLYCSPMKELDIPIPTIWVVIGNPDCTPNFGTTVHIKD